MRCPQCHREGLRPPDPCPHCHFSGDPALLEELAHVAYLLAEMEGWNLPPSLLARLQNRYRRRQTALEIALGLRPLPLSSADARQLWWEVICLEALQERLAHWEEAGWVRPGAAQELAEELQQRLQTLQARLADGPPAPPFSTLTDRLALLRFLHQSLDDLQDRDGLVDEEAYAAAAADLEAEIEAIEVTLGLRPAPKPVPEPAPSPPAEAEVGLEPPPPLSQRLRAWFDRERLWQTLLSERTLRAMLFLGVFLLFAAAVTLVVFNWGRFPPAVQVFFLAAFTFLFYALGWYVRVSMRLRNSGIALTATGSLLVPLDFYAFYLGGGFTPYATPEQVWFLTSVVCLLAYLVTVWAIEAEFFGYLVAGAAGSLLAATMRIAGLPTDGQIAALSALALLIALLAERVRETKSRWRVLHRPFWHAALLGVTVILSLAFGRYLAGLLGERSFRAALAASWWFGSTVYALGALRFRFRPLWSLGMVGLSVALYLTQTLPLERAGLAFAWHAPGLAGLTAFYAVLGRRLYTHDRADPLRRACGRVTLTWSTLLTGIATLWSFANPVTAQDVATVTGAILTLSTALTAWLWQQPRRLFAASFFSLLAITTAMASRGLTLAQLCLGWTLLAVLHLILAVRLRGHPPFAASLYAAGFGLAALALLPPLVGGEQGLLVYALGNWIVLAAWAAWLDRTGQHPGLGIALRPLGRLAPTALSWAAALPLPLWLWLTWTHTWSLGRFDRAWLGVALALLAGALVHLPPRSSLALPWRATGYLTTAVAVAAGLAYFVGDRRPLALLFLLIAVLYFASAGRFRQRRWLVPAGVTLPVAWWLILAHHRLPTAPTGSLMALVPALYLLGGLLLVHRRRVEGNFLKPLNFIAHGLTVVALLWGLAPLGTRLVRSVGWADPDRLWAAGGQVLLGIVYGLVAWGYRRERWAHLATWLGVSAGGIVATVYSHGRGSSAAKAALLAVAYVLAERTLLALRPRWPLAPRVWRLYRRPLLVAGWAVSGGTVVLALLRNLVLLGGGRVRETWAVIGLLIIVGLYALSARLFRRPLFVWLAAVLVVIPWTLLTHLGWFFLPHPLRLPQYALAWLVLAWLQVGLGLGLEARGARPYGLPLRVVAHLLAPFGLLWSLADPPTASIGWGLGVAFYAVSTLVDHRRMPGQARAARFLYPTALLTPAWTVYLMIRFAPTAQHHHFGLLLLAFGPLGLLIGRLLRRIHPADALPTYLAAYGAVLVGTLLVAHLRPWLIGVLLFDAVLAAISAWLHAEPLWGYPATAFPIVSLMLALTEFRVDPNRHGWPLIALGAAYLLIAHGLRRARRERYAIPLMAVAYIAVALGLPPSSRDQVGAFWGYGGAAVVYALSAVWLRQPLLLTPALLLAAVPYGVALVRSSVAPADYGLGLWPGIALVLVVAHLLDRRLGAPRDFPWGVPTRWPRALGERWFTWAGLPFYAVGYLAAVVAVVLSLVLGDTLRVAATLGLAALAYAQATWRFRLRGWLLAAATAAQLACLALIHRQVGLVWPARAALAFLPVTAATALVALLIQRWLGEGSPWRGWRALVAGWSRPLYLLLMADLALGQGAAFAEAGPGGLVSLGHALIVALLASAWMLGPATYAAMALGVLALFQRLTASHAPLERWLEALALLALGYGVVGYGLRYLSRRRAALPPRLRLWAEPLAYGGFSLTTATLLWAGLWGGTRVLWLTFLVLIEQPLLTAAQVPVVQMVITVSALAGLTYLAVALVERWRWLGYGAVALLLVAYNLELLLFLGQREVQGYAVPAGLYLLGIGYLEWREGHRPLARWVDRTALLLLFGSAFWQSLVMEGGWRYALLMGGEGLGVAWWGSARRLRRFLYGGVSAVVLAVVGQLVEPLFSVNRWIVLGAVGLLLVGVATLVERRLEAVLQLSQELRERLERWE